MEKKNKDQDEIPQSKKQQEDQLKEWTPDEMEEASPLPLPEREPESDEGQKDNKDKK